MNYLVSWEIDIEADTPEEAARLAREIQRDPDSTALFFSVRDQNQDEEVVDLTPEET